MHIDFEPETETSLEEQYLDQLIDQLHILAERGFEEDAKRLNVSINSAHKILMGQQFSGQNNALLKRVSGVRFPPDPLPLGAKRSIEEKHMTTTQKFSSCLEILYEAVDRQVTLDIEYPIIYNQILKHYEEKGVDFYGDVDEDYDILLTKLEQDLFYYEN